MRKIYFACLLVAFFLATNSYGQTWKWGKGNTGGSMDSWVVATDPSGNVFTGGCNISNSSIPGFTFSPEPVTFGSYTVPFSTATTPSYQVVIAKYDSSGNFMWAVGTQNGDTWLINIAVDRRGNCIVFGSFSSPSVQIGSATLTNPLSTLGQAEYFLVKLDASGSVVWAKSAGAAQSAGAYPGFPLPDLYVCSTGGIAIDDTGSIYITSNYKLPSVTIGTYTLTNADPSGSTDDIILAKYDSSGNVTWAKSYGGAASDDDAYGLTLTPAGNIYIAGIIKSPGATFGYGFIMRFDNEGAALWASGTGEHDGDYGLGLAADGANNVYLTGGLADSSISFSGTVIPNPTPGEQAAYLVKFDPANNVSWYKTFYSPSGFIALGYGVAISGCDNVWVTGAFSLSLNIDGHTLYSPLPPPFAANDPVFLAGFTSSGTYMDGTALDGGADDQAGIGADAFGNIYLCADYYASPFTVGNDTLGNVDSIGADELQYVAKYTPPVVVVVPDTITLHHDTAICAGTPLILRAAAGYFTYLWNNGATADTLIADSAGLYIVTGYNSCGALQLIDSFTITFLPADTILQRHDTAVCTGAAIPLTAPPGYNSYLWSNGSTDTTIHVDSAGIYIVTAQGACSSTTITDSFIVTNNNSSRDTIYHQHDTAVCPGTSTTFSAPPGYITYLWSNGSAGTSLTTDTTGVFSVIGYGACGTSVAIDTFIIANVIIGTMHAHHDTIICAGAGVVLTAPPGFTGYLWSNGSTAPSITADTAGIYRVIGTNACPAPAAIDTFIVANVILDTIKSAKDTSICIGANVLLVGPAGYLSYLWSTSSSAPSITVSDSGLYWVTAFKNCISPVLIDSFNIKSIVRDTISYKYDSVICSGKSLLLTAPVEYLNFINYLWDNGDTTSTLSITAPGIYWVALFTNCPYPVTIDTFHVTDGSASLLFSWPADTIACGPVTLTVPLSGPSFLWPDGSTADAYTADKSALYYVTISENGCSLSDSINVGIIDVSQHLQDTTFCSLSFSEYTLFASAPAGASVLWSTGSTASSVVIADTGRYWVTVTDAMCTGSDTMQLKTELCNCIAYLPTAFTPNNDGKNDTYHPVFENGCDITEYSFSIYNRWGQLVFSALTPDAAWDGNYNGAKAEIGTYMYYLKYATGINRVPYVAKGDITLIR